MSSVGMTGSIYSSIVAKNKGIGGLASGLDTESIMEALTTGTRAKIGKQQQLKQLAQWKQTNYRSVAAGLKAFREKHLSFASGTNIGSNSYFNTIKATTSSTKVKVTTTANSTLDPIKIDQVVQLATAHAISGKDNVKQELISGDIDLATADSFIGKSISIDVGGSTKTIKLDSLDSYRVAQDESGFIGELEKLLGVFGTKLKDGLADSTGYIDPNVVDINDPANREPIVKVTDANSGVGIAIKLEHATGTITVGTGADKLGFDKVKSNRINTTTTKIKDIQGLGENLMNGDLRFTINGVEFTADPNETISKLMERVNNSTAGVRMTYDKVTDSFEIISKTTGYANRIEMQDVQGNFLNELFGAQSAEGFTSKEFFTQTGFTASADFNFATEYSSMTTEAAKKGFAATLSNMSFTLNIGGVSKTIQLSSAATSTAFLNKIKNGEEVTNQDFVDVLNNAIQTEFNDSDTEVQFELTGNKITLNPSTEKSVTITASPTSSRDLLQYLGYAVPEDKTFTNKMEVSNLDKINSSAPVGSLTGAKEDDVYEFSLTVEGVTKKISYKLTADDAKYIKDNSGSKITQAQYLASKINEKIYAEFGTAVATSGASPSMLIGLQVDSTTGNTTFRIDRDVAVSLTPGTPNATNREFDVLDFFNLDDRTDNRPEAFDDGTLTLRDLGVTETCLLEITGTKPDGTTSKINVLYSPDISLGTLTDMINSVGKDIGIYAGIRDGRLFIEGGDNFAIKDKSYLGGPNGDMLKNVFGFDDPAGYQVQQQDYGTGANSRESGGTNAQIVVNGQIMSQSSNTFVINGTQVEVLETTASGESITINMASDPDELIGKLRDFINDYNALVSLMTSMVKEAKNKDYDYQPLTDEQRTELTTDDIEKWEIEAKKGIMRNDSTINGIMNQMRSMLYEPVGASGVSLYNLGITTVSILTDKDRNGHLEISADNEDKLREMIVNNPDLVREVFANAENGLAKKMDAVIDRAINTSSDPERRGSLVAVAGSSVLSGDNTSTLDRKIAQYDEAIEKLKTRLEAEYTRYWKQFSALETAISRMNTQSSWLTDFGAS